MRLIKDVQTPMIHVKKDNLQQHKEAHEKMHFTIFWLLTLNLIQLWTVLITRSSN